MATNINPAGSPAADHAPAPHADLTRPPVGAAGGPPIPQTIPLTVEEYQRLRGLEQQMAVIDAERQAQIQHKEQEKLQAIADKEGAQKALELQRTTWEQKHAEAMSKYTQLESTYFQERRNAVITNAFQGRDFVGQTPEEKSARAEMVQRLIQDKFETTRDASGSLVVREKGSGRPAAEVIKAILDSPEYSVFFMPTTRGGSGSDVSRSPAPTLTPPQPGSVEDIAAKWKAAQQQYPAFGFGVRRAT